MDSVLVLMATYNGEKYLEQQLESLFNQKEIDVEVLVRDDGSSDKTKSILDKWQKKAKLKWYTGEHLNVKYGFYDLMEQASRTSHQYFAFCDQDDVWDDDKLYIAVKEIKCFNSNKPNYRYVAYKTYAYLYQLLDLHLMLNTL